MINAISVIILGGGEVIIMRLFYFQLSVSMVAFIYSTLSYVIMYALSVPYI